jgi:hypothetical protein
MENLDEGLIVVPKWLLINWQKIPQMTQSLSAQIVCPSPKVWAFDEKRIHWASVVRVPCQPNLVTRLNDYAKQA